VNELSRQNINVERDREMAAARAELLRQAEREGVRPLSFDELLGDPGEGDPEKEDVGNFLALWRAWRGNVNQGGGTDEYQLNTT
jgi:hypothetical protein